jgi:REP element-mobilizing transposase RayT
MHGGFRRTGVFQQNQVCSFGLRIGVSIAIGLRMARPLRIDLEGGWYHVINRGLERRRIFEAKADFDRFIRVLGELPARFGVLVHVYALMPNHYHLLVQTPEANLSRAIQWLNVCYRVWFNRNRQRVGPLFQGRFTARLVAPDGSHLQVSRYVHTTRCVPGALGSARKSRLLPRDPPRRRSSRRGGVHSGGGGQRQAGALGGVL